MVRITLEWPRIKHRTCVLCVDNQAAVAALVKGSSASELGSLLTTLFWNLVAQGATTWWIEYVHAKSNYADHPSRLCPANKATTCATSIGDCPTAFRKAFESWDSLHREATAIKTNERRLNTEL